MNLFVYQRDPSSKPLGKVKNCREENDGVIFTVECNDEQTKQILMLLGKEEQEATREILHH